MLIHLIRHGRTLPNEKKLYCGQTDVPLSEQGAASLLDLKQQGIYPKDIGMFFTSGLLRTEETLNLLYGSVHREILPQLAEYRFGDFEMKSYAELKKQTCYQAWITDKTDLVCCPGGESRQLFNRRVFAGFDTLMEKARQADVALAVCHGGVIVTIMDFLFPDTRHFYEWQPEPGRGYSLMYASGALHKYEAI